ncbi:MAG: 2-oxo acid dehydrogenase subunit E2 [Planctomycetes bacterium]|nr:2-oxo acid dehydrogenase subunit E2 [Planctomycetota bacterium]
MFEFKLPDLGEGVHEGELLKWYVAEGDVIAEDAPLVDVETDKAAVTIPSPRGGRVVRLSGAVGDTLKVGAVIAVIDDGAAAAAAAPAPAAAEPAAPAREEAGGQTAAAEAPPKPAAPAATAPAPARAAPAPVHDRRGPVPAAPATRRVAREMGIDLAAVPGSGPGGRITLEDLKAFAAGGAPRPAAAGTGAEEPAAAPAPGASPIPLLDLEPLPDFSEFGPVEKEALRSIRRKVARKMVTSMVLVPHVVHMDEVDVTELEAARRRENARLEAAGEDAKLTMLALVMKATALCLRQFPQFNASLDPFRGELIYKKYYNLGFAADTARGLVVPVVKGVDRKNLREISAAIAELARRARDGSIGVEDFRGGTFTVTNIGMLGGTGLIPTINYPEVAILGMGRIADKPVVRGGEIVARTMLPLTLAFDHRMADGADAARFVNELMACLTNPLALLSRLV